ncbi:hypothetical protein NC651_038363 [Populus alba x Populus x berolinensis]|nr:hypothetical protein NC651_038363 [Populus alba x Populus x berolinensis]
MNFLILNTARGKRDKCKWLHSIRIALAQGGRNLKDIDIQDSLHKVGSLSVKDISSTVHRMEAVSFSSIPRCDLVIDKWFSFQVEVFNVDSDVVVLSVVMHGLLSILLVGLSVRLIPRIVKHARRLLPPRDSHNLS